MKYKITIDNREIDLDIRKPVSDDFDAYQEFIRKIAAETSFTYHYVGQPDINRDAQIALWASPHRHTVAAFDGDKMVGYFCLYATNPGHPYLSHNGGTHTYVLQQYAGHGLGGLFIQDISIIAHNLGIKRISTNIHANNHVNLHRLQKHGFEIESVARNRYFVDGQYVDCYNMVKWID